MHIVDCKVETVVQTVNEELEGLYKWLKLNALSINAEKTKFIIKNKFRSVQAKNRTGIIIIIGCNRYNNVKTMLKIVTYVKIKQNLLPEYLLKRTRFVADIYEYLTRTKQDFYIAKVNTK